MKLLPCLHKFWVHHTTKHQFTVSLYSKPHMEDAVCFYLPPALLAEWLGSFVCYCTKSNMWVEWILKYIQHKVDSGGIQNPLPSDTVWSPNNFVSILAGIFVALIQFQVHRHGIRKEKNHLIFSSAEPGQQNLLMLGIIYVHNLLIMKIIPSDEE